MLLVVVLVVAIVQSLPLSGKLHGAPDDQQGLANGETTNTYHEETPKIDTSSQTQRQTGETYKNEHPSAIKRNDAKVEEVQQQPENVNISIDGSLLSGKYDKSIGTSSEDISDLPEMSHMRYRRSGDNPFQNSHVSKCRHADRHYCLNSGTCLLVAALDIKTCRYVIFI